MSKNSRSLFVYRHTLRGMYFISFMVGCLLSHPEKAGFTHETFKSFLGNSYTGTQTRYHTYPHEYAQTEHIAEDIALDAIVKTFPCKTVMCSLFLKDALEHPFSQQAKRHMLNQQHIIRMLVENESFKKQVDALLEQVFQEETVILPLFSTHFSPQDLIQLFNTMLAIKQPSSLQKGAYRLLTASAHAAATFALGDFFSITDKAAHFFYHHALQTLCTISYRLITRSLHQSLKDNTIPPLERMSLSFKKLKDLENQLQRICAPYGCQRLYTVPTSERLALTELLSESPWSNDKSQAAMILNALAEIDALNAIATTILHQQTATKPVCFSHAPDFPTPYIKAENFWNFIIPNPVLNSFNEDKHAIISGQQGTGKTTIGRSLIQNICFHQRFGISTGTHFESPFFDYIYSYLSPTESAPGTFSRFEKDIHNASHIKKSAHEAYTNHAKLFFATDGLFSATGVSQGAECAYTYIKNMAQKYPHIQGVCITHFEKMQTLADEPFNRCTNYTLNTINTSQGVISFPYTMIKGKSSSKETMTQRDSKNLLENEEEIYEK